MINISWIIIFNNYSVIGLQVKMDTTDHVINDRRLGTCFVNGTFTSNRLHSDVSQRAESRKIVKT